MLTELSIKNFAIIEEQVISFTHGFTAITGETGAGKSIILHALEFLLGRRSVGHALRAGADGLEVAALFDLSGMPEQLVAELPDIARPEPGGSMELLISRSSNSAGRTKTAINGRLGSVAILETIAQKLINICGQNQQLRLLDPTYHRELLDGYGRLGPIVGRYEAAFTEYSRLERELREAESAVARRSEREAELTAIVQELERIAPRTGLRAELEAETKRLAAAERIIGGAEKVRAMMQDEGGLTEQLASIHGPLTELGRMDPRVAELATTFGDARTVLVECGHDLATYAGRVEVNEERLEELRTQLSELARVERKYRLNDQGLAELLSSSARALAVGTAMNLEALRRDVAKARESLLVVADALRQARGASATTLVKAAEHELKELAMSGVRVKVAIEPLATPEAHGADSIEIFIEPNRGEGFRPLRKVASGGELSRITLVLKKLLRDQSGLNVLVFDEVDTGISGGVARAVGQKLRELAALSQVICVTHLPQVASLADHHFVVSKHSGKRTRSEIVAVQGDQRIEEIARMLAGYDVSEAARASARELLASNSLAVAA